MGNENELSQRMSFRVGGTEGLDKAVESGRVATFVYSSGLQVSGTVSDVIKGMDGKAVYVKTTGQSALSVDGLQLPNHGKEYHSHGFGSPIGVLEGADSPLEHFTDDHLNALGITVANRVCLTFRGGLKVNGIVMNISRSQGRMILISFMECTVTYQNQVLFEPRWGTYDMAVGEKITSVFAGAADVESFFAEADS